MKHTSKEKTHGKKNVPVRVPGHRRLALTKRNEQKLKENLLVLVPPQRRLAISRLRVPNLDGIVLAAAGNLFSIGAPRHRVDPVIVIVRT